MEDGKQFLSFLAVKKRWRHRAEPKRADAGGTEASGGDDGAVGEAYERLLQELSWHHQRGSLLRFLDDPEIEPTNNRAERMAPGSDCAQSLPVLEK